MSFCSWSGKLWLSRSKGARVSAFLTGFSVMMWLLGWGNKNLGSGGTQKVSSSWAWTQESHRLGLKSQLHHFRAVWFGARHLTSLCSDQQNGGVLSVQFW